jgi:hypothetical protein
MAKNAREHGTTTRSEGHREKFADLGVSFFDADFTLDPFPYLEDLYGREDVLGFSADGMNFIFRFEPALQIIRNRKCRRELGANAEIEAREPVFAERYPNPAKRLQLVFRKLGDGGKTHFALNKLIMDFIDEAPLPAAEEGAARVWSFLDERLDDEVVADGNWIAERIITKVLILLDSEVLRVLRRLLEPLRSVRVYERRARRS